MPPELSRAITEAGTPLTPVQHGLWLTERLGQAGVAFHIPLSVELRGPVDVEALVGACRSALERHPILACAVSEPDGTPLLAAAESAPQVELVQAPADPRSIAAELLARPFDLERGPLARLLVCVAGSDHVFLIGDFHHVIFDGESKDVITRDIAAFYSAAVGGGASPDGEGPEELATESRDDLDAASDYWRGRDRWPGVTRIELPGLAPGGPAGRHAVTGDALELELDARLNERITNAAKALGVTRFELLMGAFTALLARYGNDAPAIGVDLGTRPKGAVGWVGPFVNELPLVLPSTGRLGFAELVAAVRAELRGLYPVRSVPFARAVPGLEPRVGLAAVSLSYRRYRGEPHFEGLRAEADWTLFNGAARNDLHVLMIDGERGLTLSLVHGRERLAGADVRRLADHLTTLLAAALDDPQRPVATLPLLGSEERRALVEDVNQTAALLPSRTALDSFAEQVAASPQAVAVEAGERTLTYAELDLRAGALAARLAERGVRPGELVAVCCERSAELVVALLAIWKAGAAYVPLDADHPRERLAFVLEDSGAALTLTAAAFRDRLPDDAETLDVGDVVPGAAGPRSAPTTADRAYVIYTSGSTGRPKGVEVGHAALANLLAAIEAELGDGATETWLGSTSLSFDIAALELFAPLVTGGRLVLAPATGVTDATGLTRLIAERGVTRVQATPSAWRLLLSAGFDAPQVTALVGGEALHLSLARMLRSAVGRLVNVYGPTETTIWSTLWEVPPHPGRVAIGRPLANTSVYVVDAEGEPVPIGVPGELWIGGAGVAHGYLGRPELTAERFVADPFHDGDGRVYRTGDRVCWTAPGELAFLGRMDDQIKLSGHRIELGEIEARLSEHPALTGAAVALSGPQDAPELVAYLVARGGQPERRELEGFLGERLPAVMLPARYVALERLPLGAGGKLDRTALASLAGQTVQEPAEPSADPGTADVVQALTAIWCEVLELDSVGPDDDLFDLGGHSLTITRLAARIRSRLEADVPLHVFYETPTVAGIAGQITEERA